MLSLGIDIGTSTVKLVLLKIKKLKSSGWRCITATLLSA